MQARRTEFVHAVNPCEDTIHAKSRCTSRYSAAQASNIHRRKRQSDSSMSMQKHSANIKQNSSLHCEIGTHQARPSRTVGFIRLHSTAWYHREPFSGTLSILDRAIKVPFWREIMSVSKEIGGIPGDRDILKLPGQMTFRCDLRGWDPKIRQRLFDLCLCVCLVPKSRAIS